MKFLNEKLATMLLFTTLLVVPVISLAADNDTPSDPCLGKICNPLASNGVNTLPELIGHILKGALKIGIPIVALAVIYSGFLFVAARGNSEKLSKAKDTLMYTLIGAAILLGSWAIAELIANTITTIGQP